MQNANYIHPIRNKNISAVEYHFHFIQAKIDCFNH